MTIGHPGLKRRRAMNKDVGLKNAVEAELAWVPFVDAAHIGVTAENGIVSLTGHVPTYAQKLAVEKAVKRIKGVCGIAEELEVRLVASFGNDDDEVAKRVANILDWGASVPKGSVKVQVTKGIVTLTGEVDWQFERNDAESGVRLLNGVRGLINQITVKPHVMASDVKQRIETALERQADIEASNIRVTVDGANVRLDGKVKDWAERDAVERAAWAAPGVRTVDDHVTINW
jgi:osmotically-inducible protein OsmY